MLLVIWGDGINDSPSLIQSDVGISVDSAVDIAKETADIIFLEKRPWCLTWWCYWGENFC